MGTEDQPQPASAPLRADASSESNEIQDLLRHVHAELWELRRRRSPAVPLWFAAAAVWLLLLLQVLVPLVYIFAD